MKKINLKCEQNVQSKFNNDLKQKRATLIFVIARCFNMRLYCRY